MATNLSDGDMTSVAPPPPQRIVPRREESTPAGMQKAGRLEFLDTLRGMAAFAVLLEHGGYHFVRGFPAFTHQMFSIGKFGLTTFFLVSGFVIPFSLERRPGLKRFWILRFFRLFPLYWFSLFAALLLFHFGLRDALTPEFLAHPGRNALANLTMLQGAVKIPHAIGLYYTLTIEMLFYITCSLLILTRQMRHTLAICWLLLAAVTALGIGTPLLLHHRVEMAGLFYVLTLGLGVAMFRLYSGKLALRHFAALMMAMAVSVTAGVWLNYVTYQKADAFEHYSFAAVALPWASAYLLFFLLLRFRQSRFPAALMYLGQISYSLYLLHPLVLSFFGVQEGHLAMFLLFIACTVAVASSTYFLIEKPALNLGQRLASRGGHA